MYIQYKKRDGERERERLKRDRKLPNEHPCEVSMDSVEEALEK